MRTFVLRASLLLLSLGLSGAALAQSQSCGGKLIDYLPLRDNGVLIGQLQMYYNASNGRNCAILKHAQSTWNKPLYTMVALFRCPRYGDPDTTCRRVEMQYGNFRYQAGPISTPGEGKCIVAQGSMHSSRGNLVNLHTRKHC